jgi:magnesium and cobalt transporter
MSEEDSDQPPSGKSWFDSLTRIFSGGPASRNDLVDLLREAHQRQVLDSDALSIIEGALLVADMQTREIMIPRSQVVVVKLGMEIDELLPMVTESGHSRFPVIGDGPDDVVGILLAKDLLSLALEDQKSRFNLKEILRPCTAVPESKRLNVLLQEFRSTQNHLAVVYDEHGGVAGIVTIEDVLEQIVGDIEDEFDVDEEDFIKQHSDNTYTVKALVPIEEFNECFGSRFSDEEFDTIGGIVISNFGLVPKRGEAVEIDGYHFEVLNSDQRRVKLLQITVFDAASKK